MNTLRIVHDGFFEGQFVVATDQCAFTVGREVTIRRTGAPFDSGEKFDLPNGQVAHYWLLPVDLLAPQKCLGLNISISTNVTGRHWEECLAEGVPSVVKSSKFTMRDYTGYVANIDGWVPGLFGKKKAPAHQKVEA